MSSNALRTVLFPEPDSPVRITSWRASRLAGCFTGRGRSVFYPPLVGAGDAHVFAVFGNSAARYVNAGVIKLLGYLIVGQRLGAVFFLDHFPNQPLQGQQRHRAAF